MTHFGIITPPVSGHLHPFGALGRELMARGHRVTCFQVADLEAKIASEGLEFYPIGQSDHPAGSLPRSLEELARRQGLSALQFTIRAVAQTTTMVCRDGPEAIRRAGIDVLLVDQMEPAGGAVAEHLGLRFATVCNALAINRDPAVPPPFTDWQYRDVWWARLRNTIGYAASDRFTRPITSVVARFRKQWNLEPLASPDDSFSRTLQISQMFRAFDFPRRSLPSSFHYVGPLRDPSPRPIAFPWEKLDGRPLVYASLGTLQNSRFGVFRCFVESCAGLNVQLVISHGGGLTEKEAGSLPGDPLVVSYAPQTELLRHAVLTLSHAGLNTVLDSLSAGVPLVTLPITYEQPGIARRVEWAGAGRVLPMTQLRSRNLARLIREVLEQRSYTVASGQFKNAFGTQDGVILAANLIESALD